jgi:ABC-type nitrate/sulfonate/bicarbonate transport system permease component
MLFFGIGEAPKLILASVGCWIIVALQVLDAVRRVKPGYIEMASNYGASRVEIVRRVYLPASIPYLFTGLRLALGWSLMITVAVEMVSSGDGLGGMLWLSWQTFTTEKLYVGVFIASMLGLLFHAGLRYCELKLVPWSQNAKTI